MSISRTGACNPLVTGKSRAIRVSYITCTEVYGVLGWLKCTVAWLRLRYKGEEKNDKYETKLLQVAYTLYYKLLQNDSIFQGIVWMVIWGDGFYFPLFGGMHE